MTLAPASRDFRWAQGLFMGEEASKRGAAFAMQTFGGLCIIDDHWGLEGFMHALRAASGFDVVAFAQRAIQLPK